MGMAEWQRLAHCSSVALIPCLQDQLGFNFRPLSNRFYQFAAQALNVPEAIRIEYSIVRDRPIVVECQYPELQGTSFGPSRCLRPGQPPCTIERFRHSSSYATKPERRSDGMPTPSILRGSETVEAPGSARPYRVDGHSPGPAVDSGHWLPSLRAHLSMTFLASPCANELPAALRC